ncbi:MAG: acid phosphatase pho5 [Thelocarpon superellum]|nr:MAG: acid phosphatase pho5 [Thelocarpon superellum]
MAAGMLALLERIRTSKVQLSGNLTFVNDWEYFTKNPEKNLEQLTTSGPYAGTLEAFTTGVRFRTRYAHLLDEQTGKLQLWASGSNRVVETARYFILGLFGFKAEEYATVHVISETADRGADTLTPGDTCRNYQEDTERGHDKGATMLAKFRSTYLKGIRKRFLKQNPEIEFSDDELYSMQETCGFETLVRGSSPWCDIFTHDDWENFEYARDVIHFYRAG